MSAFDQVVTNLTRAKDNYKSTLRSIDSDLRRIVSQDPTQLAAAKAIQASYGEGLDGADLAAAEQPAQTGNTAPKRTRRKSDKPARKRKAMKAK